MTCKHCSQPIMLKGVDVFKTPSHSPRGTLFGLIFLNCSCRIWIYTIHETPVVVTQDDFRKQRREDATDH